MGRGRGLSRAFIATLALSLGACASYTGEGFSAIGTPPPGQSLVYVYSGETGCIDLGQMNTGVLVNGEQQFTLAEHAFAELSLPPGEYAFDSSTDDQKACQGQWSPGKFWPTVTLELSAGVVHFLQYNPATPRCLSSCEPHLVEVPRATALVEMQGARQVAVTP